MEYRLFFLTPGQQAPSGSTGIMVGDGIVWIGEPGTFPNEVSKGFILPTDSSVSETYDSRLMGEDEVELYVDMINNPDKYRPTWIEV
jgi:hypothetical protein